jgi:hypothetical protein
MAYLPPLCRIPDYAERFPHICDLSLFPDYRFGIVRGTPQVHPQGMENKLVVSPDMEPSLWARYLNACTALIKVRGYSKDQLFGFLKSL